MSPAGPRPATSVRNNVGSYLGFTGRRGDAVATEALDPMACRVDSLGPRWLNYSR
jgi:hypothetical protein